MLAIPGISLRDSLKQRDPRAPAQPIQMTDIDELARRAVGARGIKYDPTREVDDAGNELGEFSDGQIFAHTDIHRTFAREVLHKMHQRIRAIVDMQEFAPRRARPPDDDVLRALVRCL